MDKLRIAIDGPAGAGKSTVAKYVASSLGIHHLDTGSMYRAFGLFALESGVDPTDAAGLAALLPNANIEVTFDDEGAQHVWLNGVDRTADLRTEAVSIASSAVSLLPAVRDKLAALQRAVGEKYSIVMDGRDITTNVLPDTPYKFFVTASVEERARRRIRQLRRLGQEADFAQVKADIIARDRQDSDRAYMPLRRTEDTMLIDTTKISVREAVERILEVISKKE
ncbi:MAG: (d)CMP kinase [Clostridiales bacterium]|nr:(d)CMP kinase [Clostridiales bacterium]